RAKEELVYGMFNLVRKYARKVRVGCDQVDLVQVGCLAVCKAIETFKPGGRARFSTYASYLIQGWIASYASRHRHAIRMPAEVQTTLKRVASYIDMYMMTHNGMKPSDRETAKSLGISESKVEECLSLRSSTSFVSLDDHLAEHSEDPALLSSDGLDD